VNNRFFIGTALQSNGCMHHVFDCYFELLSSYYSLKDYVFTKRNLWNFSNFKFD